jgi:hypothetical protein
MLGFCAFVHLIGVGLFGFGLLFGCLLEGHLDLGLGFKAFADELLELVGLILLPHLRVFGHLLFQRVVLVLEGRSL